MLKKSLIGLLLLTAVYHAPAQEIQARLTVMTAKISTQINKNVFQTLQTQLTNFINNRKWTNDAYQSNEKIQCNFLLNVEQDLGNNVFRAKLTVQAARPIFSSSYDSPL